MIDLSSPERQSFLNRLLLILKGAWCFFALSAANDIRGVVDLDFLIIMIYLAAPIWIHDGLRWLFRFNAMPLWAGLVGLFALFLIVVRLDSDEIFISLSFSLMTAFWVFRGIKNLQAGQNILLEDLKTIWVFITEFFKNDSQTKQEEFSNIYFLILALEKIGKGKFNKKFLPKYCLFFSLLVGGFFGFFFFGVGRSTGYDFIKFGTLSAVGVFVVIWFNGLMFSLFIGNGWKHLRKKEWQNFNISVSKATLSTSFLFLFIIFMNFFSRIF